jgi:hypothetical protein
MNSTKAFLWEMINATAYSDVTSGAAALQITTRLPSCNCFGSDIFLTALDLVNFSLSKFPSQQVIERSAGNSRIQLQQKLTNSILTRSFSCMERRFEQCATIFAASTLWDSLYTMHARRQ